MSTLHRAKRILTAVPGQPAIDNGAFIEKDGFIQGIGPFRELAGLAKTTVDHGETTLVPGSSTPIAIWSCRTSRARP
ncbi:hypothetical protein [Salidesulfovibrio brasiliensis]|uniref:hypothetical protein n=1 Tax=Salidesulfovibrio brasiliensis TaxID=221711 RepID=UPI0006D0665A|nr:hypothetical protein [Salidesulfovibrio brasiliensis]